MYFDNTHLRHVMLYEYRKGKSAAQATRDIRSTYGDEALVERTCQKWFAKFRTGNFGLDDEPREGRPETLDNADLEALLEEDPGQTVRELAEQLGLGLATVDRHLHKLGKVNKTGKWVSHKLTEVNKNQRLTTCISLAAKQNKKSFLHRIVTGDESWVYYENPAPKRQWLDPGMPAQSTPKPNIHGKKALLCIWWDQKGILYYELLQPGETVTAERYAAQLNRLSEEIDRKRPFTGKGKRNTILLHDNAKPHVAKATRQTIEELGWEVLAHPAYSPDLAPSDYHLFLGLKTFLREKHFKTLENLQNSIDEYFGSKNEDFFWKGIHDLPNRWEKVIAADGDYFD